jgi:hypothetical protein
MRRSFWILLLFPFAASPVFGWGCEGHQIVALIARAHLNSGVSAAVDELLRQNPIDPALNRFCKDALKDLMADGATWPDDAKTEEKTGEWHYVDIPRSVKDVSSLDPWCSPIGPSVNGKDRPGCIPGAIEFELAILRDKSKPSADRAAALRYIIHFLGDIHQPLHDLDNNDKGGNCTAMQFFAEEKPVNLHAIWDYKLIQRELEKDHLTQTAYANALNDRFAAKYATVSSAKADDPIAWAWETHAIGETNTYGNLEPHIPIAAPDPQAVCAAERDRIQALHIRVGDAYFSSAMPAVDERLATAGFRLARLLNDSL